MPRYVAPDMYVGHYTCPLCDTLVYQAGKDVFIKPYGKDFESVANVRRVECGACDEVTWWIENAMVYPPVAAGTPPPHEDMPDDVRQIYNEARAVAELSARSAAALLRTALETLLKDHFGQTGKLNNMIGDMVKADQIGPQIQKACDLLRCSGNNAVHPRELSPDDNRASVTSLFNLLNMVVNKLVSEKTLVDEMYDRLEPTLLDQVDRRDGT